MMGSGFALLLFFALLVMTNGAGWWQAGNLLGTARRDVRSPDLLQRVSLNRLGTEGNSDSFAPSISADGRFVVFLSTADNLVEDDANGLQDVFLFDRTTQAVTRVSVGVDGSEADGPSSSAQISRNGRFVAFVSEAANLVEGDKNGFADVFLYERESGRIRMVSVGAGGVQGDNRSMQPALSADGRFVAFVSLAENLAPEDENGVSDIFVADMETGTLELISVNDAGEQANDTSKHAAISANGRIVAFQSKASNLSPEDHNGMYDIFVRDREQGETELVSRALSGGAGSSESQRPSLSNNGQFVAFESWADDLVAGDENYQSDVFVLDRQTGVMELASVSSEGEQADHVNGGAAISGDGRTVAFSSLAGNLVGNDENRMFDVYLRDRVAGQTRLISLNLNGVAGSGSSISPSLTASGNYIVFDSVAPDLVADDDNGRVDVFIFHTPAPGGVLAPVVYLPLAVGP